MKFDPKSEREVSGVLEDGTYDFTITDVEERPRAKTGRPMLLLQLNVYGKDGQGVKVRDCIGTDFMEFKLRHLMDTLGLIEHYNRGEIDPADLLEQSGRVKLGSEDNPEYGMQNVVKDYEKRDPRKSYPPPPAVDISKRDATEPTDDDIPF